MLMSPERAYHMPTTAGGSVLPSAARCPSCVDSGPISAEPYSLLLLREGKKTQLSPEPVSASRIEAHSPGLFLRPYDPALPTLKLWISRGREVFGRWRRIATRALPGSTIG